MAMATPATDSPSSEMRLTSEDVAAPPFPADADLNPSFPALQIPFAAPPAAIQIHAPGPMSSVRSPIRLRGYLLPGFKNRVHIELVGEDGRLLARRLMYAYTSQRFAYFAIEIPFEIKGISQLARLQVSTEDESGRISALAGVRLLLLSSGYEDINPAGDLKERCILFSPAPGEVIGGGTVSISGYARPMDDLPLIVELIGAQGQALASRLVSLGNPNAEGYSPFTAELPYSIAEPVSVRLTVRQPDGRIGGTMYLYSQEIILTP